ncbi:MAG: hypothetical protein DWP97_04350 [Calditrichaeota bacterium]|nr:MAG: hypothetical protein DWP97_04350 [Calditrichota bacterium]
MNLKNLKNYILVVFVYLLVKFLLYSLSIDFPLFCSSNLQGVLLLISGFTLGFTFMYFGFKNLFKMLNNKQSDIMQSDLMYSFNFKYISYGILFCVILEVIHRIVC